MPRKQSPETQVRHLRREVKRLDAALRNQCRMISLGQQISNICFNLAQKEYVPAEVRACLDLVRKQWDSRGKENS